MQQDVLTAKEMKNEGLRLFQEGLYEEAADAFRTAREMFEKEGNKLEVAEMTNNLGILHRVRREWDEAVEQFQRARETFARLGDRNREAQVIGNLGGLYASMGKREKAKETLREAADIFGEIGDTQRQGETLQALAVQMFKSGDRSAGVQLYQSGLQTLDKPSLGQRMIRGLLKVRNRLMGSKKS